MAAYVRIAAYPTVDNPDEFPLYADFVVDDGDRVSGNHSIFGFQGEMEQRSGASMPFILRPDGRMDFGQKYVSPDRFYHFNLRDVRIEIDQLVTIRSDDYEATFRIRHLSPLA